MVNHLIIKYGCSTQKARVGLWFIPGELHSPATIRISEHPLSLESVSAGKIGDFLPTNTIANHTISLEVYPGILSG
jgi:hypothetical protein